MSVIRSFRRFGSDQRKLISSNIAVVTVFWLLISFSNVVTRHHWSLVHGQFHFFNGATIFAIVERPKSLYTSPLIYVRYSKPNRFNLLIFIIGQQNHFEDTAIDSLTNILEKNVVQTPPCSLDSTMDRPNDQPSSISCSGGSSMSYSRWNTSCVCGTLAPWPR